MQTSFVLFVAAMFVTSVPAVAQANAPGSEAGAYKVEFNIHDARDNAAKTARRYVMLLEGNEKGVFKVGEKVPYATASAQFNYAEIGVNIECHIRELSDKLRMYALIDLSTILGQDKSIAGAPPIIGQLKTNLTAEMTLGKPTLVASMDDPTTSRRFDVEATVTKVD